MTFAHTDSGRPLLGLLAAAQAGCPIDPTVIDPQRAEAYRQRRLAARAGDEAALAHPALHFELGQTRRTEVLHWLGARAKRCELLRAESVLQCRDLDVDDGPRVDDLHLQFDSQQRLVAVDIFRRGDDASASLRHFEVLGEELEMRVGPATATSGAATLERLRSAYARADQRYRYRDYEARISVTQFAGRGLRVREQYQWLPPRKHARR